MKFVHEDEFQELGAPRHVMRAIVILLIDGDAPPALHGVFARGRIGALDSKHFSTRYGGSDYATGEASFEEKACDESRSGSGSCRVDSVDGGRRVRVGGADRRPADDVEHRTDAGHHAR